MDSVYTNIHTNYHQRAVLLQKYHKSMSTTKHFCSCCKPTLKLRTVAFPSVNASGDLYTSLESRIFFNMGKSCNMDHLRTNGANSTT